MKTLCTRLAVMRRYVSSYRMVKPQPRLVKRHCLSSLDLVRQLAWSRSGQERGNHERNGRMVYVTKDLGQTWTEHPTSGHVLTEPTCQGSLLKHMYEDAEGREHELLLFFNPNDPDEREHYTMKCSLDEGMTWPEDMWLEVDEYSGRGYSCMISLDNDTVGVLYEGSGAC